jgi:hypothetical protein
MGVRESASGGEYDLSNPVSSFPDVARAVVLRPARFFDCTFCLQMYTFSEWAMLLSN